MSESIFVAKESDLEVLIDSWKKVKTGAQSVLLTAPFGGGKRAIVNELARRARQEEDVLVFRATFTDEDNGQSLLVKLYASLFQFLHANLALRGKVEMALSSQIPSHPERVQQWYRSFIEGMKAGAPKPGEERFQVHLPRDNPLLAYIEIVHGLAKAFPTVLAFQNTHSVHSLPFAAMLKGLLQESRSVDSLHLLTIVDMISPEENAPWLSDPLLDVINSEKEHFTHLPLTAWTADEVTKFAQSKGVETFGFEEKIIELTEGRPGFIDELITMLQEDEALRAKLPSLSLSDFADITPDEEELEEPEIREESARSYATSTDAGKIAYTASLLGPSFPSGVVADMLNLNRDSVDDIFDATEHIYKELQNSKPLNTWIYQFKRALYRESILARFQSDEDKKLATQVGNFVERFLSPSGYGYVTKALNIYKIAGEKNRAALMKNVAMGSDQPQLWLLTRDIYKYYDEVKWSDPMRRMTFLNLCERMSAGGDVNSAETILQEAQEWANEKQDKAMLAFLSLNGSKLDARRRDLYRARTRANDALALYKELDNPIQQAETLAQLALIELNDGKTNTALERLNEADALTDIPPVKARTSFLRGLLAQREKEHQDAINHFVQARTLAGQSGRGPLLLDASMKIGEMLFMSKQFSQAADELSRVAQLAQNLKAPMQERAACALLAQAHGAQKNFEAALQFATRTLQLSQQLKFENLIAADLYSVGLFNMLLQKPSEAVAFFKQASAKADSSNPGFRKELYFNMGQALLQIGERSAAEKSLETALKPATEANDHQKVLIAYQQLGDLAKARNENNKSSEMYNQALRVAKETNNKEAQKALKERIKELNV